MIDPVAKNLFASGFYPTPNLVGTNNGLQNNYLYGSNSAINQDQGDVKVDYNLSAKDRISGRYSRLYANDPSANNFQLFSDGFVYDNAHSGVANWTHTFGPNVVNEVRAGVNYVLVNNGDNPKSGLGDLGTTIGIANANSVGPGLLGLNFSNGYASGVGNSIVGSQQLFASTVIQADDTLVITKGQHTIHTGFQFFRERINVYYAGKPTGIRDSSASTASIPAPAKPTSFSGSPPVMAAAAPRMEHGASAPTSWRAFYRMTST